MSFLSCKNGPSGGSLSETLLWSNSSPASTFAAQTITVADYSSYKYLKFIIKFINTTSDTRQVSLLLELPHTGNPHLAVHSGYSGTLGYCRSINTPDLTSITFGNALEYGGTSTKNNLLIPLEIYGVK